MGTFIELNGMTWVDMSQMLPVKAKSTTNAQITQSFQKCEKYTELWWTFYVQAIYDNISLKY